MPPQVATVSWTLETLKVHPAYPTFLQFMRDENDDQQWEVSQAEEDMDTWVEWLADNQEAIMEATMEESAAAAAESAAAAADEAANALRGDAMEGQTGGGAAADMDIEAPRADSRPPAVAQGPEQAVLSGGACDGSELQSASRVHAAAEPTRPTTDGFGLTSKDEASKVEVGHVLDVYKDSKTFYGRAVVNKVVAEGETVTAEVSWDDGDASSPQLVLYSPAHSSTTWPRWQPSSLAKTPLFLRLAKAQQGDLFRAPVCADVKAPEPNSATPSGIFGAAIDSTHLGNSFLANGLGGSAVVFATGLEDGRGADAPLSYPRIFDIYGVMHEVTGAVKSFYVCCGHATPLDLKKSSLATEKGFVLGLEFAVLGNGRAASAVRTVEFRAKGNKAIDSEKEPPIVAHALGDTKMRVRPVDSITELSNIIGSNAVSSLRALLLRSELCRVLVTDVEVVEGRHLLSLLDKFPEGVGRAQRGKLGEAVLMQALRTTVKGLEMARAEQVRTFTADKETRALAKFTKTAEQLVKLAGEIPQLLHLAGPFNEAAQQKLLARLLKMEPKLGVRLGGSGPKAADKAGADKAGADRKRPAPDIASGNSPANGKGPRDIDHSLRHPRLGALLGSVSSDSSSGSPAGGLMTPLGLAQMESNSSKVIELGGKLQAAEQTLMQVRAELAEEKRTSARLQGELTSAQLQITALRAAESTIAGLRAELKVKDQSLADLRHSQALWSSMFMAKTSVEPDSFERLMRAQKGDRGGSSSSQ